MFEFNILTRFKIVIIIAFNRRKEIEKWLWSSYDDF